MRAAAVTVDGVAALVAAAAPGCSRQLLLLLRVGGGRRRDLWRAGVPGAETVAVAGVVACMVQGEASRCCGRLCLGASMWMADPGHGGLEMGSADICVRAVGMEVRWWCSPPLFLGRAVRIRRRCGGGAGWLALYSRGAVVALRECTESSLRQWRHGGGGCMFAAACLDCAKGVVLSRAKAFTGTRAWW